DGSGDAMPARRLALAAGVVAALALAALVADGAVHLVRHVSRLSVAEWLGVGADLGVTAGRVAGTLVLGALWAVPGGLAIGLGTAAGGAWDASIVAGRVRIDAGRVLESRGIGATIARAFDESDDARLVAGVVAMCAALLLVHRFVWKPLYRLSSERFALNR